MPIADLFLFAYLVAPVFAGVAILIHASKQLEDRIAVLILCLLVCSGAYAAFALELFLSAASERRIGIGLGTFALLLYLCTAVLAIHRRRWAWGLAVGALVLHLLAGLFASPRALAMGRAGIAGWAILLGVGALGLLAALQQGTRWAVSEGSKAREKVRP